jgi:hypothetical protein
MSIKKNIINHFTYKNIADKPKSEIEKKINWDRVFLYFMAFTVIVSLIIAVSNNG